MSPVTQSLSENETPQKRRGSFTRAALRPADRLLQLA